MSSARVGIEDGAERQSFHGAIDSGNPTAYKPKWLFLDEVNIDLTTRPKLGFFRLHLFKSFAFIGCAESHNLPSCC